ncbi:AMP-binding protein [Streptomyces sp. N2-109]|uniref:AMP-binding protein n=1 Tax=Streptomyces gossypii TaxID=2883101 RepID=A0ABT2JN45_9ACTN|nr:AMP-binding protein [Streptomyces gossypii]MCT2589303.1 AMP-binding protein [Streptomyces gossypii]
MWLTQLLERNRQCFGARAALADMRGALTWDELALRVEALASRLAAHGVRHGDRVAVLSRDRKEVVETYFALGRIGALFVPLDPGLVSGEIAELAAHAKVAGIIGERDLLEHADQHAAVGGWRLAFEDAVFQGVAGSAESLDSEPHVRTDDPVAILYTSATGGHPKGVVVDHRSVKDISLGWLAATAPPPGTVLVTCGPLFHGTVVLALAHLAAGATLVIPGPRAEDIVSAARTHQATHMWLVPETLQGVVDHLATQPHDTLPASLTEILYGAAPLSVDLYAAAARSIGCGFRQVYGLTEAGGPLVTLGPDEHPDPYGRLPEILPAGRVIPGMSVRVCDAEGKPLPEGHTGEVQIRGDGRMRGYWRDPAATAAASVGGWLRTGDLGYLDGDGRLHLVDRLTEVIIRNGRNIYPAEIERVLRRHAAVVDAAVVPVTDGDEGEVPLALVVLAHGAGVARTEILGHLADAMAEYKIPKDVRIIEELPRGSTGKVQKKLLTA